MSATLVQSTIRPGLFRVYVVLVVLLPWSFEYSFGSWAIQLPAEPLLGLTALWLFWEIYHTGLGRVWRALRSQQLWLVSLFWIGWMGISAFFSALPIVSFKYWLVEAAHWWVFAVGMAVYPGLWLRILPYFGYSMLGVTAYTIIHHSFYGFRADQALLAPMPFFPDHNLYAAVLSMLVFYQWPASKRFRQVAPGLLYWAGLLLSTSRAAILATVATTAVAVWQRVSVAWRWFAMALCLIVTGWLYPFISNQLQQDVSFLERLNRWDCARAMLQEKPLVGYGPGTYQFEYFAFQQPENMTRISVSAPIEGRNPGTYGRGGGAHSEYWQAAAEMGWPGLLIWISMVCLVLCHGFSNLRLLAPALGLLTFFLHALFNEFLHDASIAWLVWGGMMWLSALSIAPGEKGAQQQQEDPCRPPPGE